MSSTVALPFSLDRHRPGECCAFCDSPDHIALFCSEMLRSAESFDFVYVPSKPAPHPIPVANTGAPPDQRRLIMYIDYFPEPFRESRKLPKPPKDQKRQPKQGTEWFSRGLFRRHSGF